MKERTYMISAVATKYNIHPQTLRMYEREGLLIPSRSEGNTRIYLQKDLKRLEFILNMSRDMGVNLAGIEVILNMKEKIDKMQKEFARFLEELKKEVFKGKEDYFEQKKEAIVKLSPSSIALFENGEKA